AYNVGTKIAFSSEKILEFVTNRGLRGSARTISVFFYRSELKSLWQPHKTDDAESQPSQPSSAEETTDPGLFYMESQLEDFIVENWNKSELGKKYDLIEEAGDLVSQQFKTDIGIIDILAKDKKTDQYVVIELKKSQTSD